MILKSHLFYYRNAFRVITAGGGTGGPTLYLGERLNHTDAELVYLDFSASSMKIAQERARIRTLTSIIWVKSWIEDMPKLGLSQFDYVQCSGVLHHLKNPLSGLNALNDILKHGGGMEIVVYATLGRTGLYHIRTLLSILNTGIPQLDEVKNAMTILGAITETNWFSHNALRFSQDFNAMGDIGIYDMFLHKRDVSYSIGSLYSWILSAGLHITGFSYFRYRAKLNINSCIWDSALLKQLMRTTNLSHQQAIAELMHGNIHLHLMYASRIGKSGALPERI